MLGQGCGCGCGSTKIKFVCDCEDCDTAVEFEKVPSEVPTCCGKPMKRVD